MGLVHNLKCLVEKRREARRCEIPCPNRNTCAMDCNGMPSAEICNEQSNIIFVAKQPCEQPVDPDDPDAFIVKLTSEEFTSRGYFIEICKLFLGLFNLVLDTTMCILQLVIKSLISLIIFLQSLFNNIIRGLYNCLASAIQLCTLVPCFIGLCLVKSCRCVGCINMLSPCTILHYLQVVLITLVPIALFLYFLKVTLLLDKIMEKFGYERLKTGNISRRIDDLYFKTTEDFILRNWDFNEDTTRKYGTELEENNLDVTEKNFFDFLTDDKVTPYTEEEVNFTEIVDENSNLKDLSMYDTLIEYDVATEKIDATASAPKKKIYEITDPMYSGTTPLYFDKTSPEMPDDGESIVSFVEVTQNYEGGNNDQTKMSPRNFVKVVRTTTKTSKSTPVQFRKFVQNDVKTVERSVKVTKTVTTKTVTETIITSTEYPEEFVVLDEDTTKREVYKDVSDDSSTVDIIYDETKETTANFEQEETSRKFEQVTPKLFPHTYTKEVETVRHFEEVTLPSDVTLSKQESTTESQEEFVMLEESTTTSQSEEDVTTRPWIVIDADITETTTIKFEEVTDLVMNLKDFGQT